jgi:hypothetical protein
MGEYHQWKEWWSYENVFFKDKGKGRVHYNVTCVCFFVWNNFENDVHKSGLLMKNEGFPKGVSELEFLWYE